MIAEADESDRSLLYLNPSIAIVTNIDAEHLDTYKDLDDVKTTFKNFLARLPFYGKAFVCIDDPNVRSILPLQHVCTIKYGLSSYAQIRGEIEKVDSNGSTFGVYESMKSQSEERFLGIVRLNMPGEHNVLNSLAAIGLALEFEVEFDLIKSAIESFSGVERRFELKGVFNGAEIFDDYGHHPTEIQKVLSVAKMRSKNRLHVVFQPHRYSRTEKLWDEFVQTLAFGGIDVLFLTDIYPASEDPIDNITSERLAQSIRMLNPNIEIYYYSKYESIAKKAGKILVGGDLFITVGAGKANSIGKMLLDKSGG